mgnify:CR=1 FL=1
MRIDQTRRQTRPKPWPRLAAAGPAAHRLGVLTRGGLAHGGRPLWRDMLEVHLAGGQLLALLVQRVVLVMLGLLIHTHALLSFSVQAHQDLTAVHVELFARGLGMQAN